MKQKTSIFNVCGVKGRANNFLIGPRTSWHRPCVLEYLITNRHICFSSYANDRFIYDLTLLLTLGILVWFFFFLFFSSFYFVGFLFGFFKVFFPPHPKPY